MIYIALSTGLLVMLIYYKGLQRTEAKVATIMEMALPLLAIIIDVVFYKNFLVSSQYLAALVLMWAMCIALVVSIVLRQQLSHLLNIRSNLLFQNSKRSEVANFSDKTLDAEVKTFFLKLVCEIQQVNF